MVPSAVPGGRRPPHVSLFQGMPLASCTRDLCPHRAVSLLPVSVNLCPLRFIQIQPQRQPQSQLHVSVYWMQVGVGVGEAGPPIPEIHVVGSSPNAGKGFGSEH